MVSINSALLVQTFSSFIYVCTFIHNTSPTFTFSKLAFTHYNVSILCFRKRKNDDIMSKCQLAKSDCQDILLMSCSFEDQLVIYIVDVDVRQFFCATKLFDAYATKGDFHL